MRPVNSVALATWMLEHLTFGPHSKALSGDLLEEFRRGRSANWYRRQVLSAIAAGALHKSRGYAFPLLFSLAWSVFYPAWRSCLNIRLTQIMPERWVAIDWPYSTALRGIGEIFPAVLFLWLGLFVYLISRTSSPRRPSPLRLLASLSISLNVFLLVTIGIWIQLKPSSIGSGYGTSENLRLNSHLVAICVPLALSLFSAITSALPQSRHRGPASLIA